MKDLIYKYFHRTITDSELEKLRNWIGSKKNKETFEAYVRDSYAVNMIYNNVDTDKAFHKILNSIKEPTKVIPLYKRNFFKYAAAILIFVSAGYFFLTKDNLVDDNTPTIVNNTIKIGTDKATLTLEDGTDITLEKGQQYIADNLESNGEDLVYTTSQINQPNLQPSIAYNYLTIPRGGQYHVKLSDGTEVWLNSESQIKYPVSFSKGASRQVELVYGEAYFDVSPSTKHNGSKFKVITGSHEIEVLGTEFNVSAYKDDDAIYTTLIEGKVAVANGIANALLNPDEQSILDRNTMNITVQDADVKSITAWMKGDFGFYKKPLKKVMKVLSRWYDVDVIFVNKELEDAKFIGQLSRDQNIEEILIMLKDNAKIISAYEINNNTIIIK